MHPLGTIACVDPHIFCGEIARPVARCCFARVQIHDDQNVLREKFVAGGALVEIERLAAPQNRDSRLLDVYQSRIEIYARAPGGGEDATPVRVAARKSRLYQRRSSDGFGDSFRGGLRLRVAYLDFDYALRAFAIGNNLQRERAADFFKRGGERAMARRPGL